MKRAGGKPVIGIVGGVGAGKSTVAAEFVRLGCALIDADAIGHKLLGEPAVKAALVAAWGAGVLGAGGKVDRAAVAEHVFGSPRDLRKLDAITHPQIRRGIMQRLARLQRRASVPAVVVDAALLLETDWHKLCTVLVYVSAPARLRAERVARSKGWDRRAWKRRENSQKPLDKKAAKADYRVSNSCSLSCLREQVRSVFHQVVLSADRPKDRPCG